MNLKINPANIAPATDRTRRLMADDNMNKNTHHHWASLGFWLAQEYSRQGIMSAILEKLVPNIMQEFNLIRLEATVWHPNIASKKVLEKNGFVLEGVCKKFHYKNGEYFDRLIFALVL